MIEHLTPILLEHFYHLGRVQRALPPPSFLSLHGLFHLFQSRRDAVSYADSVPSYQAKRGSREKKSTKIPDAFSSSTDCWCIQKRNRSGSTVRKYSNFWQIKERQVRALLSIIYRLLDRRKRGGSIARKIYTFESLNKQVLTLNHHLLLFISLQETEHSVDFFLILAN